MTWASGLEPDLVAKIQKSYMGSPLSPGTKLDRYEIRSQIGAGGMGEVYLAQDTRLERTVALKVLPANVAADRERMQRFIQEAKAASGLNHPNILTVYEIGQAGPTHFIATEYIAGETLRQLLDARRIEMAEGLDISAQIASALSAAHGAGIIHRDIKPENIMRRSDGIVKVLDFGLAKQSERVDREQAVEAEAATKALVQTEPGVVMGTAAYMSPEQARGKDLDARTDIFSLGAVIYEIFSGRAPFAGETAADIIGALIHKEPQPLSTLVSNTPAELQHIVSKALRKDRDERYQTVKSLLVDLKTLKQELDFSAKLERSVSPDSQAAIKNSATAATANAAMENADTQATIARPTSGAEYLVGGIKQHKRGFAVALAVLLLAAIGFGYWFYTRRASDAAPIESLAVMPFANASGNSDVEYLSDGITESLINSLSQLPKLSVKARSSVFRYKGKEVEPQQVAKELSVQAILNGRLVQRGDDLALYLSLVDARNGNQLWGEQYNRKLTDLVALQSEIARDVSQKLRARLSGADEQKLAKNYTANVEAYQLYLRGRYQLNRKTEDSFTKGIGLFQQAIEQDPNYALAYAGLADAYNEMGLWTTLSPSESFPKAKAAAERALQLDSTLAEAHTALAFEKFQHEWDFAAAEREYQQAINLNPHYAPARELHGYQMYLANPRRFNEAMQELNIAHDLDPLSLSVNFNMAALLYFERQYDKAAEKLRELQNLDPSFTLGYGLLEAIYRAKRMNDEAVAACLHVSSLEGGGESQAEIEAQKKAYRESGIKGFWRKRVELLEERAKARYVSPIFIAMAYAILDDEKELTFEWLDKAYRERSSWLVCLGVDPVWDNLRSDPRFADLMRRVGLPQ